METIPLKLADGRTVLARADVTITIHSGGASTPDRREPVEVHSSNFTRWCLDAGRSEHYWAPKTTTLHSWERRQQRRLLGER